MNELFGFSTNPKTTHVKKRKEKKLKKKKKKEKEKKVKRTQTGTDKTNREHSVQTSVENSTEWRNEDFLFLTGAPRSIFLIDPEKMCLVLQ